jgi:hypothetical protein
LPIADGGFGKDVNEGLRHDGTAQELACLAKSGLYNLERPAARTDHVSGPGGEIGLLCPGEYLAVIDWGVPDVMCIAIEATEATKCLVGCE